MATKRENGIKAIKDDLDFYSKELSKQAKISGQKLLDLSAFIDEYGSDKLVHTQGLGQAAMTLQSMLDEVIVLRNVLQALGK
jgi:hypothetical protein